MSQDDAVTLSIGELAEATDHSVHTLRYYDDQGMIPRVRRNEAGHRRFSRDHVRWIGLLDRLKASGMSISRMRRYADLAARGDGTVEERKALLEEHEADVRAHIAELERCLRIVRAKVALYDGRLDDPDVVWRMVEEAADGPDRAFADGVRQFR